MILVIGGVAAGKRTYVERNLGISRQDIAEAELDGRPAVSGVQELLREMDGETLLPKLLEKRVVICDEVGSGVIPLDAENRLWREAVGRLCCRLSDEAGAVVRVFCGIPTVLKGEI